MSNTQDEIRELRKKTASLQLSLDRMTTAHSEAKAKLAAAEALQAEQEQILCAAGPITCRNGIVHQRNAHGCLYCELEAAETEKERLSISRVEWTAMKTQFEAVIEAGNAIVNRCEKCGANLIDNCPRCGAPVCCPQCCKIDELEAKLVILQRAIRYIGRHHRRGNER